MSEYKDEKYLLSLIRPEGEVKGKFEIEKGSNTLMDLDLDGVKFKDCVILGGDFCSSIFNNCTFDNALFKNSAFSGVTFNNCDFNDCKFSNIQISFSLHDCKIRKFIITQEDF